ncbi:Hypothetical predicted protein [Mytilus galloprovincialis]|uniref:Plasminogen n=1 Tax=Mytilus galloprovincialis TaxID=29158 RepID=A0A8B6F348_MYTGA|nr:Hypothetical predicted protein [Mytilus galloprovincialis]
MGLAYNGTVNTTRTGLNCKNRYVISMNSPTQTEHHNYCRNPDDDPNGPWCFTTDPDVLWEECSIPLCDDITTKPECVNYTGTVSTTDTGRTCQYWSRRYPHVHDFTTKLANQHNYCRNPDNEPLGPWCYTTDSETRWEYCTVPFCDGITISPKPEQNCRMNQQGKNYNGKINKTRFGQKCQAWKSLVPNKHPFAVKLADDEDYCRNPDTELYGPWCYTTDPGTRWEYCDVPYCEGADNPSKENWKYGWQGFEDSYYSIQYTEKSWVDAKDFCKTNLGAYLAEITTPEENDFLMNLLPKPTADNSIEVWLGARDLKREREFTWDNSATYLDYTDWGPNEPNGDDWYFEDCLATHLYRDGKLHWNDRSCAARNFFVCEKSVSTAG